MEMTSLNTKTLPASTEPGARPADPRLRQGEAIQTVQAVARTDNAKSVELGREQMEQLAEQLEGFVSSLNRGLRFSVHEESGRQVVTVVDSGTGETVRQIPSEELLDIIARLAEASGGLIDVKV